MQVWIIRNSSILEAKDSRIVSSKPAWTMYKISPEVNKYKCNREMCRALVLAS